jgi:hypothetical protein
VKPELLVELAVVALAFGGWFALFAVLLFVTRPRAVQPNPPTQDFGGQEPPAVVSLLANHWEITEDAAESTLIDLAARRYIEFRQPANDPMQTTIHLRDKDPGGLTAYERRILDRVRGLAVGGVVPLPALTFRDPAQAAGWAKRLRAEVVADARARGLSQRRFAPWVHTVLGFAALVVAGIVTLIVFRHTVHEKHNPAIGAGLLVFGALSALAGSRRGERDTPQGREVAARWLGLRAYLLGDESVANLPPASVAVWDRYQSYGDAVGATRVCAAVIDLGMGNRRRVWSSFGGAWHRVRVRYPTFWGRYGKTAPRLVTWAVVNVVAGAVVLRYRGAVTARVPDVADLVTLLLGVGLVVRGGYRLVRALADLGTQATFTGEVLWTQVWRSRSRNRNEPSVPWLYYFAVDDGGDDRTTAWGLPAELHGRCQVGDVVRVTVRRWSRRVISVDVQQPGRTRALAEADASSPSDDTESLVAVAMGLPSGHGGHAVASALRAPAVAASQLLTADEVGRAIGRPVTGQNQAVAVGPLSVATYSTVDGAQRAVNVALTEGLPAQLAMRGRRKGVPLPGIGDEAYAGDGWAMARRGDRVVVVQLHPGATGIDPRYLAWLLSTAVSRLPG